MFDVITFGSATRDVFIRSSKVKVIKSDDFRTGEGVCFSLGSKVDLEELSFFVGGGAVNTAVTFSSQGLKVAAVAAVGEDIRGREIIRFLKERNISTAYIYSDPHELTAYSIIFSANRGERTIFRYRGAVWHLHEYTIPWSRLRAKWFYINHVGDESASLIPKIIACAKKNNSKIAFNPGRTQFEMKDALLSFLKDIDVFIVNQEEASFITDIPYKDPELIFTVLDQWVKGIVIMTKGPEGVEVSDGMTRWSAGILPTKKIVDRTGAGDAFGSGFITALIKNPGDIAFAIQFASANATGVLTQWGATNGILKKGDSPNKWGKLKIKEVPIHAHQ